ncbi:MAG: hypothetical protein HUU55_12875 [Myxococcales bacterium]|nr:hypothetical protein [Myxococcales bacterium]
MKRLATLFACLMVLALVTSAQAKDMDGKFGVGYSQSLTGGASGLGLNYWAGDLKIGAILGIDFFSPDGGDSETNLKLGLQGLYAIARSNDANLNFGLRVNIGVASAAETAFGLQFDLPLEGEYFLSDHFSLYGHVGLTVTIVGEDGNPLAPGKGKGFGIGVGDGGFSGGAGFNFYF